MIVCWLFQLSLSVLSNPYSFMKSYSDYMEELSSDELLEGLLGYGLFAEKIPQVFSSKAFYDFYIHELNAGHNLGLVNGDNDYVRYDSIRNTNIPRSLGIPNPLAYASLCKCLSDNWDNLKTYFGSVTANQTHKVSRVHIRKLSGRQSVFEMNYKNQSYDGDGSDDIMGYSRYRVSADISSCFPSIYTHTIPWAVEGKANAKLRHNHWSDDIDKFCRETKFKETSGILIGPHAYNLISEIILCKVDEYLVNDGFIFTRCIDDYCCYVKTIEEAEQFLLHLNKYLKEFELSINQKKTQIYPLPETSETDWIHRLNTVYLGDIYREDGKQVLPLNRLRTYLDIALTLTLEKDDASPLKYAIKVISSKYLGNKAQAFYIKRLKHLVSIYTYLAPLLEEYVFVPFNVSEEDLIDFSTVLYQYGNEHNRFEACSYSIYWAIRHNFQIKVLSAADVIETKDCVYMLLSYLYSKQYLTKDVIKQYKDSAKLLRDSDMERYWLFVYEVLPISELKGKYKILKQNNISFISL